MNLSRTLLVGTVVGCILGVEAASAFTADNPYTQTITNRNLFGLKPPPDPNDPANQPPPPPLRKITLSGITTILGKKMAVLRVPRAPKPGEPPEVSHMLSEGSTEDDIQVLQIDIAAGTVKIRNANIEQVLDITKDSPKGSTPTAPAGGPAPGNRPPGFAPAPGSAAPTPPPSVTGITRPVRGNGVGSQDSVPGGGPSMMGNQVASASPPPLSLEEQTIMVEVNRMKEPDLPFPPTDLTPVLEQEQNQQNGNQQGQNPNPMFPPVPQ